MSTYVRQVLSKIGFDEEGVVALTQFSRIKSFSAGDIIWDRGRQVSDWCYIITGMVAESTAIPGAGLSLLHVYGERTWFGEQSIYIQKPTLFEFNAMTDCELLTIPLTEIGPRIKRQFSAQLYVAELMAWRIHRKTQVLALMKMGNPLLRVVVGLVLVAEALKFSSARPPTVTHESAIEIPVGQKSLASLLGVSRTLLSEYLKTLEREGWLTVQYGSVEIQHLDAWRKMAERRLTDVVCRNPSMEEIIFDLEKSLTPVSIR